VVILGALISQGRLLGLFGLKPKVLS
jgi:hypothetical protein